MSAVILFCLGTLVKQACPMVICYGITADLDSLRVSSKGLVSSSEKIMLTVVLIIPLCRFSFPLFRLTMF